MNHTTMENGAIARAPYGRFEARDFSREVQPAVAPARSYGGETYYGEPALNPSHYGQLVAGYLFIGGVAGASQVIAGVADLCGREENRVLARAARYLALGGALAGPVFLIADLETPQRWYNMLRIFRRTSAMSIGSWTLAGFGTASALVTAADFAARRLGRPRYRNVARWAAVPATAAGAVVATYTGTLLAATSTPLWAAGSRRLPVVFGLSGAATASSALLLMAHGSDALKHARRPLEKLALITSAAELLASRGLESQWERQHVSGPLKANRAAAAYRLGYKGIGLIVPLLIHGAAQLTGRRARPWSIAAALASLAGGYIFRSVLVEAGKESARRAQDYFHMTQGGR
jgi:formate-dependent nitrite reductase membrane component NrfD